MTTAQLLRELYATCYLSSLVDYVDEQVVDVDVLMVRVYLTYADTFINVFYNLNTGKTAFALVSKNQRLYGIDNARIGWHKHPFEQPDKHEPCTPVQFEDFLADVESYYRSPSA